MVGKPVSSPPPLTRVLARDLMFFGEYSRLVPHMRRAMYGGDRLMGGVKLRKISAMHNRKLLLGYLNEIKTVSDISAPDSPKNN